MPKRNLIWTILIVAAGVATVLLTRTPPPPDDPDEVRFRPVVAAYRRICDAAYRPVDDEALRRGAVGGMADAVDPFSSYVPPERVESFRDRLNGYVTALGLLVDVEDPNRRILGSLPGSPAHAAGIDPGGRLLAVAGREAERIDGDELRALLEGPSEQAVPLTLLDPRGRRTKLAVEPARFALETVMGVRRGGDGRWRYRPDANTPAAIVRIAEFVPRTADRLRQVLRELGDATGLVLDLRDNPGGRLEIGFDVANLFLREGVIFTRVDRTGGRESLSARSAGTHEDVPLVVLVNERTASAAEIVAGALAHGGRAALVGTRTRGKGLIQSMLPLPGRLGLANVTTGEFFLGRARKVAGDDEYPGGIAPHRVVTVSPAQARARRRRWRAMAAMPPRRAAPATATAPARAEPVASDSQLAAAIRLLAEDGALAELLAEAAATQASDRRETTDDE